MYAMRIIEKLIDKKWTFKNMLKNNKYLYQA